MHLSHRRFNTYNISIQCEIEFEFQMNEFLVFFSLYFLSFQLQHTLKWARVVIFKSQSSEWQGKVAASDVFLKKVLSECEKISSHQKFLRCLNALRIFFFLFFIRFYSHEKRKLHNQRTFHLFIIHSEVENLENSWIITIFFSIFFFVFWLNKNSF